MENLPRVREAIEIAASKVGRDPRDVTLVAITKAHPVEVLEAALSAGLRDLGENRLEELEWKVGRLGKESATWHMVGHVQSRKARQAAELADLVHSVDTLKLARRISGFALERGKPVPVLVQANLASEESKSGFAREALLESIHEILELGGLEVRGLMTMAPFVEDEGILRSVFSDLRRIHEDAGKLPGYRGRELSMGMTNDFELAVEEGSTMVRIGTALFGERPR
ncbi:MAG: YggS family pyridoxal phosphate-dependent enzyme [Gemmatimonadetes bacterium]|nr:YggS family pyridoxal phosphate-dependent enzyme [Gemmatimonadota bacterium]NNM05728.1 YggS family pyridoxal phosphate-dependent enzyme [Gemmatimonadota bacterium]